ncbi:MAG: serine hydrolase domain-containing protein [Chthoniobacteraceae bacterium]
MKSFSIFILLVGAAFAETVGVSPQLDAIRQQHALPALGAAAMREGELVAFGVSGTRQFGKPEVVKVDDLWHIGSCTKSMTATLAGILVDEGTARWDMKITDALPELRATLHADWREATLEQLLTHRSGAPHQPQAEAWSLAWQRRGSEQLQRMEMVRSLVVRRTEAPVGTKFIYSNRGYTIAGAMLEKLARKPYAELLRAKVFAPLGMKSCGVGGPGENQPRGHTAALGSFKPVAPDADNPPAITPAGRVHCSLADFVRFASWHARGPLHDVKLMSDATFQKLHTRPAGQSYAMGWVVTDRPWADGEALTHNGSNTMWHAVMWIAPAKQTAFVAVTNCAGDVAQMACDEAVSTLIRAGH